MNDGSSCVASGRSRMAKNSSNSVAPVIFVVGEINAVPMLSVHEINEELQTSPHVLTFVKHRSSDEGYASEFTLRQQIRG